MKIVLVGAGNVATSLATNLQKHNHEIIQIYSRTTSSATLLADAVYTDYTTDIAHIRTDADVYIFSVKDSVLELLAEQLPPNNGLWLHTAGSMPLTTLSKHSPRAGVIYPLQTFTKGRDTDWNNIPIFVEANSDKDLLVVKQMASELSNKVYELSSDKRRYVHLTGVFASNFTNHMYALSELMLSKAGLPFDVAIPLIDETCAKIHCLSPQEAQTGPAIRFDENVMNKHLQLMDDEQLKDIYRLVSESIHERNKNQK